MSIEEVSMQYNVKAGLNWSGYRLACRFLQHHKLQLLAGTPGHPQKKHSQIRFKKQPAAAIHCYASVS
jgi:hypothetical protein